MGFIATSCVDAMDAAPARHRVAYVHGSSDLRERSSDPSLTLLRGVPSRSLGRYKDEAGQGRLRHAKV